MADKLYDNLMKLIENGGAAFPFRVVHADDGSTIFWPGMTLRDYLAGQAIAGLSVRTASVLDAASEKNHDIIINESVNRAYKIADAMLKERE